MDSIELYRQLLGVTTPWSVERVEMDVPHLRVDVYLEHASGARFMCPECGVELSVYDHTDERTWRHLDSCHFQTLLHARPPRVQPCARRAAGSAAVGRARWSLHEPVRSTGHRCAAGHRREEGGHDPG